MPARLRRGGGRNRLRVQRDVYARRDGRDARLVVPVAQRRLRPALQDLGPGGSLLRPREQGRLRLRSRRADAREDVGRQPLHHGGRRPRRRFPEALLQEPRGLRIRPRGRRNGAVRIARVRHRRGRLPRCHDARLVAVQGRRALPFPLLDRLRAQGRRVPQDPPRGRARPGRRAEGAAHNIKEFTNLAAILPELWNDCGNQPL